MMSVIKVNELFEQNTPAELAEAYVFPVKLTKKQKEEAVAQLSEARAKLRKEITQEEVLSLKLMRFKLLLEKYIKSTEFKIDYSFGYFLSIYIDTIGKKRTEFADEIDIHETLLSQLINNKREPNESLMIRLEIHSNGTIPALDWLKLVEKKKENYISTDKEIRKVERQFVKNHLAVSF
ncbi:hypothetical protein CJD36_007885 [Flavipsychrobacter stenotrophus]|uniref:Uncharacterized protein n=1 Tax=Flavipsychrobacter stenotrophus TaxID=2077091 RepID=A0A2S7SYP3_9BACT|nr:hypothetical protein [Flavipsychrobacter stenotrophus]PQJ11705.1 hypothetical protein CJD36_007885 [Flavipsychrobacter stenotrophus]